MAKHREPDGLSARVLIFLAASLAVLVGGVVWAVTGPVHVFSTPAADSPSLPAPQTTVPPQPLPAGAGVAVTAAPAVSPRSPAPRAASSTPVSPPASRTSPSPAGALTVSASTNSWPGIYSGNYTVANGTAARVNGWTVVVTFGSAVSLRNAWNAQASVRNTTATFTSVSYNSQIDPGRSQGFGFQVDGANGATPVPVGCTVNGKPCTG
jgi:hypothetical protein